MACLPLGISKVIVKEEKEHGDSRVGSGGSGGSLRSGTHTLHIPLGKTLSCNHTQIPGG